MIRFLASDDSDSGLPAVERRRSDRVSIDVPVEIDGIGPARLVDLSLGGAALETSSKVSPGARFRLCLEYGEAREELSLRAYRTRIQDLFYSSFNGSRIRYRVQATFDDPTIPALNLVYRILREHWVAPPHGDDTEPIEDSEPTPSPKLAVTSYLVSLGA